MTIDFDKLDHDELRMMAACQQAGLKITHHITEALSLHAALEETVWHFNQAIKGLTPLVKHFGHMLEDAARARASEVFHGAPEMPDTCRVWEEAHPSLKCPCEERWEDLLPEDDDAEDEG